MLGKGLSGVGGLPGAAAGWGCQAPGHEAYHGPFDHGFGVFGEAFVVAAEAKGSAPARTERVRRPRRGASKVRCPSGLRTENRTGARGLSMNFTFRDGSNLTLADRHESTEIRGCG